MSNISITAPLVNNSQMTYITPDDSCLAAVDFICGDDTGAPVRHVVIEVKTATGKTVRVFIPNDRSEAVVYVGDEII
jgi:hypothetical protein